MRCRGGDSPARRCIGAINRLSLKWHWPPICHCEGALRPWQSREGSYVFAGSILLFNRVLRDSHVASLLGMTNLGTSRHKIHTSNIASLQGGHSPQGHAASVRPQSRQRLRSERRYRRNWFLPFYRQSVRIASVMPGAACRSPTTLHRYSANKQQKQGRTGLGASLFFQLLIPPPAWACRGAYTWSSSRRGGCSHSRCSGTGGRRAACAARRPCTPGRSRAARRPS